MHRFQELSNLNDRKIQWVAWTTSCRHGMANLFVRATVLPILTLSLIGGLNHGCSKPSQEPVGAGLKPAPTSVTQDSDNDAAKHFNTGIESAKKGNLDEAITSWKKAIEIDPKFIKAHNYLARSYYTKERFDDALSEYKTVTELDPADAMAQASIGFVYRMKEMYDDAIAACNKALQTDPRLAAAYNCIGLSYTQKKMYAEAVNAFKSALEINPNYADALFGLGVAYNGEGKTEESKQAFETFDKIKDKTSAKPAH
ncbi:MAG TPA: tetratricopeptide repeat protein [Candidatus Brocadiia bacterium]|nr:tetratricopeptide repeat protein [Planctomycetota bacterium]MDO8092077.1 tetratricopeptide repeat protein [Candidatus Brocadiales bacterium]